MSDELLLKWGTLKGWDLKSDAARAALKRLADLGPRSMSAAMQHDTAAEKQAICELIDAVDGTIQNDWSGEVMTKDEAKRYVLEYRTSPQGPSSPGDGVGQGSPTSTKSGA